MPSFRPSFPIGARVGIVGMGISGRGVLSMLAARDDLKITLRDKKPFSLPDPLPFRTPVRICCGDGYLDGIDEDFLFLSPSLKADTPKIREARERGARISSDLTYFLEHTTTDVFAVSGSDGKSTTATLTARILAASGERVMLGGNIGVALSPFLSREREGDKTVIEASSFQLMLPYKAVRRALVTNLTPNHLDYHSSLEEYYNVKLSLLLTAKEPIVNGDDAEIVTRYGKRPCYAAYTLGEAVTDKIRAEHVYTVREGAVWRDGLSYFPLDPTRERGATFQKNLLAAIALCDGLGTCEGIRKALSDFVSLPHRRERIRELDGVTYYNSSVDSSPSRTIETLSSFSSPVVLILGGRSKGVPYGILSQSVRRHARCVIVCGENADEILCGLSDAHVPLFCAEGLVDALALARANAREGDAVLLSPASTSFDRYRSFEERGEIFRALVNSLE